MDDNQERYLASMGPKRRGAFEKVFSGKASPRACIRAKCQDCCGHEDLAENVGLCPVTVCPLWQHRPNQKKPKHGP